MICFYGKRSACVLRRICNQPPYGIQPALFHGSGKVCGGGDNYAGQRGENVGYERVHLGDDGESCDGAGGDDGDEFCGDCGDECDYIFYPLYSRIRKKIRLILLIDMCGFCS